ncbi:MAG: DNA-3-methyladenine glycosylase 2 family protein [Gammaproteobacteria bacterium]|nr:DNA-3-methyladenine glycosylase 2 family protein [Gammaproteobacteria bacterium]
MNPRKDRNKISPSLTKAKLLEGVTKLCRRDPDLNKIVVTIGPPPMWVRKQGFSTLVYIILEQKVSIVSAKAVYQRLMDVMETPTPQEFLGLSDSELKLIGFSRQKMRYCRLLAESILTGVLDLSALRRMSDDAAHAKLTTMKGIGPWSADVYLLTALRRPDIWPSADIALAAAVQRVKRLRSRPTAEKLEVLGRRWTPWRSVAARLLWHHYLNSPK